MPHLSAGPRIVDGCGAAAKPDMGLCRGIAVRTRKIDNDVYKEQRDDSDIILEPAHASRLFFPQCRPSKRGASTVSRLSGAFADEPS